MREIETKIFYGDLSPEAVIESLSPLYELHHDDLQHDFIYSAHRNDILSPSVGTVVCRVRYFQDSSKSAVLTAKRRNGTDLDREEFETTVADGQQAQDILAACGLTLQLEIRKRRWTFYGEPKSHLSINVDEISGLGTFIEFEVLDSGIPYGIDAKSILRQEMKKARRAVGVAGVDIGKAYDRLLLERDQSQ